MDVWLSNMVETKTTLMTHTETAEHEISYDDIYSNKQYSL